MTDQQKKEFAVHRLKCLHFCLGTDRVTFNFYRFEGLPYDLELALTHLIESLDSCRHLVETHLQLLDPDHVRESDSDQES